MLLSEMFGVEREVDFKVKGYESLFKVMQGAGGGGMSDFHRYPIEDVVSDIHNSKPFEERKEICIHANASQVNAFEHAKHIIRKHEKAMLRELTEWQNRIAYKQYDAQTIQEMCSELGREIGYLDDVIAMLEKAEVEG